ncbi:type II toxin-antitoxin system HicA family toxin [Crocosphaera sp. Alani8]|uniref:type II toxin-antitoxin system HicA family toxin n=1 Tax=Crocosphaera sp. Alani8 TaxID=3038952 RepID=UPI00313C288B
MNKKQRKIYDSIFTEPMKLNILWDDVVTLIKAVGGTVTQENNSGVRFDFKNLSLNIHSPHPQKELKRYQIKAIREFLFKARINP